MGVGSLMPMASSAVLVGSASAMSWNDVTASTVVVSTGAGGSVGRISGDGAG